MKIKIMFTVAAIVLTTNPASADIVHNDDVIIIGSECVGLDCVVNQGFGFDTIKLQENNLRILFDDTSTAASFPRNDWRLIANDSANGGVSKFVIEDATAGRNVFTVEAGARENALYVDSSGDVGIGTNNPSVDLQIKIGDTPTLRLEQDGSSGFTPQTWDVAGNETNFFIRDVTNGSQLPFRIRPDAPTSAIEIAGSGNVGIGDSSPDASLNVERNDGTAQILVEETNATDASRVLLELINNGAVKIALTDSSGGGRWKLQTNNQGRLQFKKDGSTDDGFMFEESGEPHLGINVANPAHPIDHISGARLTTAGVWTDASSRSLKNNIREIDAQEASDALYHLQPVTYTYKRDDSERYAGFIAEDVPEIVAQNDRKGLSPMDIVAVLTKVVKEQANKIESLTAKNEESSAENEDLSARLTMLENIVNKLTTQEVVMNQ